MVSIRLSEAGRIGGTLSQLRCISTYFCTSDILIDQRCGWLFQRIQEKRERGRRVSKTQQFRDQEQVMCPAMGKIDWSHDIHVLLLRQKGPRK